MPTYYFVETVEEIRLLYYRVEAASADEADDKLDEGILEPYYQKVVESDLHERKLGRPPNLGVNDGS